MKYLFLLSAVLVVANLSAQTRVTKVTKVKQISATKSTNRVVKKEDINRLNLETKIVGKTALPVLYRFKDKQLILNGEGLRELLWVDVYACGLYMRDPETDPASVINKDKTMIVRMDILSKAVSHEKLVNAFRKGFEDGNNEELVRQLTPEINSFLAHIKGLELKIGDKVDIVYEPKIGISLYINYNKVGTVGGLDFKRAIMNIWLSKNPVDKSLKPELLNGAKEFLKD